MAPYLRMFLQVAGHCLLEVTVVVDPGREVLLGKEVALLELQRVLRRAVGETIHISLGDHSWLGGRRA